MRPARPTKRKKRREKLVQPHWLKDSDPEKPKTDAPDPEENFFEDFAKATPEEKAAKWQALKNEQHAFIATWKKARQKSCSTG